MAHALNTQVILNPTKGNHKSKRWFPLLGDGEILCETPVSLEIVPGALKVVTPQPLSPAVLVSPHFIGWRI